MDHQFSDTLAPDGGAQANGLIKDTDIQNFGADVIEASKERPVIVDFWADWCGPCKQLMPALENAVKKADGKVALVKVNADQNQTLCAQMQVQSLPTVLAFWQGQPIDGFQGALPQSHVDAFVDKLCQATGANAGDPMTAALEEADRLLESGEHAHAQAIYHQIISASPGHIAATIGFCSASLGLGQLDIVKQALPTLNRDEIKDKALTARLEQIDAALELADLGNASDDETSLVAKIDADPNDHESRLMLAKSRIAAGDKSGGAEHLLGIIMRDRDWQNGDAKTLLLKLFDAAGPTDPFTLKYRRRLSSILFS